MRLASLALAALALVACHRATASPSTTTPSSMVVAMPARATVDPTPAPTDATPQPIRVAITVDDLPSHGPRPPGVTRLQVHERLLAAFAAHHVPQVYGFINGGREADGDDERASLAAWVAAGQPLGNHTFSHPRLRDIGLAAYLKEIDANEAVLAPLMGDDRWRVFRYPYLFEGTDRATTTAIREHLAKTRHRVAEVTIDFYDWAFNPPYVRCLANHDDTAVQALRDTFLRHAIRVLQWNEAASREIWGRPVAHILLLHVGAFDAEMIEPLLQAYEDLGVQWISLDEALEDPIYAHVPTADGVTQGTLVDLAIEVEHAPHPPWFEHPDALLAALCKEPQPPQPRPSSRRR
ncbi:MAG: polysaccharide deacetylase family protein [Deltaproteobacteria bacterium]|nr:polysaccharide deacetylase family protein [Deltaproteobacteria bacterium]MBK8716509.1 polysaccharide deacetylase family protein [Deltaproteobacteria bacterium]MBP7287301.1 polysaccharide deacetylase family protein [Nannocystaceae bacterium]